jgi:hypothetical protein
MRISVDFLAETLKTERTLHDVFQVIEENNCHFRLLYPAKSSFRIKGEIKTFQDKHKLRKFVATNQHCNILKRI